jgi:CRP-like cAMP-binding protein
MADRHAGAFEHASRRGPRWQRASYLYTLRDAHHRGTGPGIPEPGRSLRKPEGFPMATQAAVPRQNRLLGAIPEAEWERFAPHLSPVDLRLGEVVYESGVDQAHVYFPVDSIVSLLYVMKDGSSAEIAIVGNEGLVGISLFMGGGTTPDRAVVQSAGTAFRMRAQHIRDEFVLAGPVQQLFLRYTQALLTQMGQTAVCNRHHSVDQQLCRWLLMSLDRLASNELTMTQELIANMLGVRREGVTEAAGKLQRAGVIEYRRGRIRVLDRPRLESMSCECYEVVREEFRRLLPWDDSA